MLEILLLLLEEASRANEYIDDSDGDLGGFVGALGVSLAEAILSMELGQVERDRLVRRLEKLIDYAGDYGMEGNLHIAVQAAKYGWDDIPKEMTFLQRFGSKVHENHEPDEWDENDERNDENDYEALEWGLPVVPGFDDLTEAKLNVLDRQGRTEEYLALCKKEERHLRYALKLCDLKQVAEAVKYAKKHLSTAEETLLVARHLRESRLVAEAIEIGELGLKRKGPKAGLGEWLGPGIARRLINFFTIINPSQGEKPFPELTDREHEVLDLIAQGASNNEISQQLVISPKTVRNHVSNIFNKLQVVDRAQAIIRARDVGMGTSEHSK